MHPRNIHIEQALQLVDLIRQIANNPPTQKDKDKAFSTSKRLYTTPLPLSTSEQTRVSIPLNLSENEITDRIGWRWSEKQLLVFYTCLLKYGFISCKFQDFKGHFFGTQNPKKKIIWLKYRKYLIYIFQRLEERSVFPENKKIASMLSEHFAVIEKNKVGKKRLEPIDRESVKTTLSDLKTRDNYLILDDIISTVQDPDHPKVDLT